MISANKSERTRAALEKQGFIGVEYDTKEVAPAPDGSRQYAYTGRVWGVQADGTLVELTRAVH